MSTSSIVRYREWARRTERDPGLAAERLRLAFAEELSRLLRARGLTRTELAARLGKSRAYVTRILNTDYNLTLETMANIALALDARVTLALRPAPEDTKRGARPEAADYEAAVVCDRPRRVRPEPTPISPQLTADVKASVRKRMARVASSGRRTSPSSRSPVARDRPPGR